ncbi:MAG: hypothetical protein WDN31_19930 [Hyphomicrobium sp.]
MSRSPSPPATTTRPASGRPRLLPQRSGGEQPNHWLALVDIAQGGNAADREADLQYVEGTRRARPPRPTLQHRLASVLDALDYNVPIPLWEAASRTPQTGGRLPAGDGRPVGAADASKKQQFGRTVLIAMKALRPHGRRGCAYDCAR